MKRIRSSQLKAGLYYLFLRTLLPGSLILLVPKLILRFSVYHVVWYAAFFVFLLAMYLLFQRDTHFRSREIQYAVFSLVLSLVFLPSAFFVAGGVRSGAPLLYIFGSFAAALLLDGVLMVTGLVLNAASFAAVLAVSYRHPDWVLYFSDIGNYAYLFIPMNAILLAILIGESLRMIYRNYRENQKMLEELMVQLNDAAVRDPLTGAYDRGFLMDSLHTCIAEIRDGDLNTFSLILLDLDHFKAINDRYGHLAGDDCIRNLTAILRHNLRGDDVIARYGGEEFICVLRGADEVTAYRRAEQIREAVAGAPLSPMVPEPVTISGGITGYREGRSALDYIADADRNLYTAKRRGRNRIVAKLGRAALRIPELRDAVQSVSETGEPPHNRRATDKKED